MTLAHFASVLACILLAGAMIHVIMTDLRSRRIRNWLIAALIAVYGPLTVAAGLPPYETGMALGAAAIVFAAGFGCFAAGWLGGGDAKLAPVCVLWLGGDQALHFVALTALIGGAMALAFLAMVALRRRHALAVGVDMPATTRPTLPYGVAMAFAALILLGGSPWTAAL
jgi:prepilin peptidase CpaA